MDDEDNDELDLDLDLDQADPEDREAAVRARSAEILARVPTPEELAEHEERCRANKIAAIMAREPPRVPRYPALVTKRRDDARLQSDDAGLAFDGLAGPAREVAARNARRAATSPRSEAECDLIEWWARLATAVSKLAPADAMVQLLRTVGGQAVAEHRQRDKLEARVAKLEARGKRLRKLRKRLKLLESGRSKPRVRVPARRLEVVK